MQCERIAAGQIGGLRVNGQRLAAVGDEEKAGLPQRQFALTLGEPQRCAKRGRQVLRRECLGARAGGDDAAGAQHEGMREGRGDFFDVVGHEDEGGAAAAAREFFEEAEEFFPRDRIEPGAGFVENEELRASHEGTGDEHALALALREVGPLTVGDACETHGAQQAQRRDAIGPGAGVPEVELRVFAADHRIERHFRKGNRGGERAGHHADVQAEFPPIGGPVAAAEHGEFAVGGGEKTGEGFEEGGLAGAVGAKDDPVFARDDAPINVAENRGVPALYAQAGDFEDGLHRAKIARGWLRRSMVAVNLARCVF